MNFMSLLMQKTKCSTIVCKNSFFQKIWKLICVGRIYANFWCELLLTKMNFSIILALGMQMMCNYQTQNQWKIYFQCSKWLNNTLTKTKKHPPILYMRSRAKKNKLGQRINRIPLVNWVTTKFRLDWLVGL